MKNTQTLRGLQGINELIYRQVNDRDYDPADMIQRIHRYATQILKCERKERIDHIGHYVAMGLSWSLALANRLHIDVQKELWTRFPGVCPYCSSAPCSCKVRREDRAQEPQSDIPEPSNSFGFQVMLHGIYPMNTLNDSAKHLSEEVGELSEAFHFYRGKHGGGQFEEIVTELIDVITNLFAVASSVKIDLSREFQHAFEDGCYRCHLTPCQCGFVTDKSVSIR